MKPFRIDQDNVPCFTSNDIDDYGLPEYYGYERYRVIGSRDKPMVVDFKLSSSMDFRPIHRYNRYLRFKNTLLDIIGERGKVPDHVLQMIKNYMKPDSKDPWNDCRKILKHFKQRHYYNNIPYILKHLKLFTTFQINNDFDLEDIMNVFKRFVSIFEKSKHKYKRIYFPNMRYMVLKLLEQYGLKPNYKIPFARTTRKNKLLDQLWTDLFQKKPMI